MPAPIPQTVALALPDDVLWTLHRVLLERLEGERKQYVDELAESLSKASKTDLPEDEIHKGTPPIDVSPPTGRRCV